MKYYQRTMYVGPFFFVALTRIYMREQFFLNVRKKSKSTFDV